ncbi:MAG: hypothetical protein BGO98_42635 [Myxococcales bacterium 68-20]|nr:response regulator [Myxococcales bacterium]OJY29094.1 MAG: hypothetical protein BGO98_42635 [Myxococcales bacterium 68-20]
MQRLLIIEDDPSLRRALVAALSTHAAVVRACSTVAEARATLPDFRPELMVLDVSLPDGDAFDVLASAHALPAMPIVIGISGEARADQAFRLAQRGVRAFIPKPLDLATLERALSSVLAEPPDLVPHLRAAVGCAPVREVEAVVRRTMVSEALGRTRGSKNGAAKILRVSRQLLQHMVRGALQ